jgi:uncharacterized protein YndB with AHSA1/START domain
MLLVPPGGWDEHGAMLLDVEQLLRLWTEPLPEDDDAAAHLFRQLYADSVMVNGTPLSASDMAARARLVQAALAEPEHEVLAVVESADAVAVAFRLAGRHVGPLDTPAGRLPASGARIDLRVIGVLTVTEGRISALQMVGDWLDALAAADLVRLPTYAVELTAAFPHPPVRLWRSLVEPAELVRWWGPHGFTTSEPHVDLRPGGRYRLTMQPPMGEVFHVTGEFVDVDPPRRLSFTFRYEEPAADDVDSLVVLVLASTEGGSEIALAHGPFATEERRELHRTGWTESCERLRSTLG